MKKKVSDCKWEQSCDCLGIKQRYCELCQWYRMIDSGYGWCTALPTHVVVAWCRDICTHFTKAEE